MPNAIVVVSDGKKKVLITSQIKDVEVVPGEPEVKAQPAQEAVEGHPGEPADPVTGLGGKPPIEAKEAKEAVPGKPAVPERVKVDGTELGFTAEEFVALLNR